MHGNNAILIFGSEVSAALALLYYLWAAIQLFLERRDWKQKLRWKMLGFLGPPFSFFIVVGPEIVSMNYTTVVFTAMGIACVFMVVSVVAGYKLHSSLGRRLMFASVFMICAWLLPLFIRV